MPDDELMPIVERLLGQTIAHGYLVAHLLAALALKSGAPKDELKRVSDAINATLTVAPFGGGAWSVDRITQAAQNEIDGVMGLTQALMRSKR